MGVSIRNYGLDYSLPSGDVVHALDSIDFDVRQGEIVGLVGESGCGKSSLAYSILRVLPRNATPRGQLLFGGKDLLTLDERALRDVRWAKIGMVFQSSLNAFSPVHRIVDQLAAVHRAHTKSGKREARDVAAQALLRVGLPADRLTAYPHEFSGGMRQRAAIALALLLEPDLLIADEPTTALDVVVQEHILELIREWQQERPERSVIFVSHDIGVVTAICDRIAVMYAGLIVETCTRDELLNAPQHPYTQALLECLPSLQEKGSRLLSLPGGPPDLRQVPVGCPFAPRCSKVFDACLTTMPDLYPTPNHGTARCLLHRPIVQ